MKLLNRQEVFQTTFSLPAQHFWVLKSSPIISKGSRRAYSCQGIVDWYVCSQRADVRVRNRVHPLQYSWKQPPPWLVPSSFQGWASAVRMLRLPCDQHCLLQLSPEILGLPRHSLPSTWQLYSILRKLLCSSLSALSQTNINHSSFSFAALSVWLPKGHHLPQRCLDALYFQEFFFMSTTQKQPHSDSSLSAHPRVLWKEFRP